MSTGSQPGKHRRGTDVRQRQAQVAVRLNPRELAVLKEVADRTGQTLASALREGFLRQAGAAS
jgi:hypothetical protein